MYKFHKFGKDYSILKQLVISEYEKGLKCKQISINLNLDRRTVGKWLKEEGFVYSKVNKANINSTIFSKIDNEDKAYWLGFIYADGYVSCNSKFELSLAIKDLIHLEKFKKFIQFEGNIYIDHKVGRCRLLFQDSEIVKDLKRIGCTNKKSLTLTFPEIESSLIHHFIRGYFDGDGCINSPKESISIQIVGTFSFLSTLHQLAELSETSIKHRNSKHSKEVFTDLICGNNAREFCQYMYSDATIFLERKHDRFIKHSENFKLWIDGEKFKGHKTRGVRR